MTQEVQLSHCFILVFFFFYNSISALFDLRYMTQEVQLCLCSINFDSLSIQLQLSLALKMFFFINNFYFETDWFNLRTLELQTLRCWKSFFLAKFINCYRTFRINQKHWSFWCWRFNYVLPCWFFYQIIIFHSSLHKIFYNLLVVT